MFKEIIMFMNVNRAIAVLTTRLLLGFIFLMQGYGKVFIWGIEKLYNMDFFHPAYKNILPDFITMGTAYYTSYVELIGGLMLVVGFKRDYALYALASVLIIVTFGHGLAEPIWDLSHVMYRAILLICLLIVPKEWDRISLDYYLQKLRTSSK
jgi:putative oxidoreductase